MGENPIDKLVREGLNELPTSVPTPAGWAETLSTVKASGALGGAASAAVGTAITGKLIVGGVVITSLVTTAVLVYPDKQAVVSNDNTIQVEDTSAFEEAQDEVNTAKFEDYTVNESGVTDIAEHTVALEKVTVQNNVKESELLNGAESAEKPKQRLIAPGTIVKTNETSAEEEVASIGTETDAFTPGKKIESEPNSKNLRVDTKPDVKEGGNALEAGEAPSAYPEANSNDIPENTEGGRFLEEPGNADYTAETSTTERFNESPIPTNAQSVFFVESLATPLDVNQVALPELSVVLLEHDSALLKSLVPNKPSRFSLLPYVSVDHSIINLQLANHYSAPNGGLLLANTDRQLRYTLGARLLMKPTKNANFEVQTGVYFMNKGSVSGMLLSDAEALITDYSIDIQQLEIPLLLSYRIPLEGFGIRFLGGAHVQQNLSSKSNFIREFNLNSGEVVEVSFNSKTRSMAMVGAIGFDFRIARGLDFYIEPTYRYSTKSAVNFVEDTGYELPLDPRVSSFGLGAGVILKLK